MELYKKYVEDENRSKTSAYLGIANLRPGKKSPNRACQSYEAD